MVVTFIVFHCYPGRDEKLGIVTFIILINANINFLLSDCNAGAQTEQVEMTGRYLSCIVALPYPLTPSPHYSSPERSLSSRWQCRGLHALVVPCTCWEMMSSP